MVKKRNTRRDELIKVAIDLFAEKGYAGTSIRDIANTTGHSVSNVYHYFENKEALWLAILEHSARDLPDQLTKAVQIPGEPIVRFANMLNTHLEMAVNHRREAKIFFIDEEHLSEKGMKINQKVQREVFNLYKEQLLVLQEANVIQGSNLNILAFNLLGNINWHLRWHDKIKGMSKKEVQDEVVAYILRGLSSGRMVGK